MIDLFLDSTTHDLLIVNSDLTMADGAERVRQQIDIKLKLWAGEWFLDNDFGTPYLESILGKQISLAGAVAAIKASILEIDGIDAITRFEFVFNRSTRSLEVDFDVQSTYGIITYGS